jgi:hypothetical protein
MALLEDEGLGQQHAGHSRKGYQQQEHLQPSLAAEQEASLINVA